MRLDAPFVRPISDVRRDDVADVGGKGANLGELTHAAFAVPEGFIVTTAAYTAAVQAGRLGAAIADGLDAGDGTAIRAAFERAAIPHAVRTAITEAYAGLDGERVAVRSSATAEDLPGAAFAGQQDTYLGIAGEQAVLDAVRRCWASLWTDRAIAYRRRLGLGGDDVAMAVVVQRQVEAEVAGVMFTADPLTGERSRTVIEAVPGLGEALVSGTATPERFVLDGGGTIRGDGAATGPPLLDGSVVEELAALGRSVAEHFGRPQDIEWARAEGRTWLLQARPMTALPPPPMRLNPLQRRIARLLLDYVTVRPYPLDMSAWTVPGIGRLVERMLAEIPGVRVDFTRVFPQSDGVVERFAPPSPRLTRATLTAPVRILTRSRRYRPHRWTDDVRFVQFRIAVRELTELDPATLDWPGLFDVARRALAVTDLIADLRVDYLPRAGVDLLRLRAVLAVLGRGDLFWSLLAGAPTRTEDANRALNQLAARVRAQPTLRAVVTELEPADVMRRVAHDDAFADFRAALETFLAEYGHRETTSLLVISSPTWRDDPAAVLGLVRVLVEERPPASAPDLGEEALRRLLDHRLIRLTRCGGAVRRSVDAARSGMAFREDTHFYATAVVPVLRAVLLEAGDRLTAAGVIRGRDEVLHLRLEELEAIGDPSRMSSPEVDHLRALVRQRSARRAELAGVPLIATSTVFAPADLDGDVLVSGAAASGGRVTGPVRVITGSHQFATMRNGEVLVCPYTNPAWTPLFQRAAAVVADSGGVGSHAAIVAREYGIPAVMGTGSGTSVLRTGQVVTVDGNAGRVDAA